MEKRNGPDKWDITADFGNPYESVPLLSARSREADAKN